MKTNMAVYMKNRRGKRRVELIRLLGSQCSQCQSYDDINIDHIEHTKKEFSLSGAGLDKPWKLILKEAEKCQLLCEACHKKKTNGEGSNKGSAGKLTEVDIREIKKRLNSKEASRSIGKLYGVAHTTILDIKNKVSWNHLK